MAPQLPHGFTPFDSDVEVIVTFEYNSPTREGQFGGPGDIDNLVKFLLDACNDFLFQDDRKACRVVAEKRFGSRDGIRLCVRELA